MNAPPRPSMTFLLFRAALKVAVLFAGLALLLAVAAVLG